MKIDFSDKDGTDYCAEFSIDENYGADADGRRGQKMYFLDEIIQTSTGEPADENAHIDYGRIIDLAWNELTSVISKF